MFFVKATRLQSSKCLHPKILPAEKSKADLLLGHGLLVLDFFNHDYSEVLERVVVGTKMLVDFYGIFAFHVISMLVYTSVALLGFKLAHVLLAIGASVAPGEVDCIF